MLRSCAQSGNWSPVSRLAAAALCAAGPPPAPPQVTLDTFCSGLMSKCTKPKGNLLGVAGAPGSGKTTVAAAAVARLNELHGAGTAKLLQMDGFHLTRAELDALPAPEVAHARRGAPFTFDAEALVNCLRSLNAGKPTVVPAFDHVAGDPTEGELVDPKATRILLAEGNYLLLGRMAEVAGVAATAAAESEELELARWREVRTDPAANPFK